MDSRTIIVALLLAASSASAHAERAPARAAAAAPALQAARESPIAAARRLYASMSGHDVVADARRMTGELSRLVAADNACSRGGELCELAFDPWLAGGGQEGGVSGTPRFTIVSETANRATVRMDYMYVVDAGTDEAQSTLVELARSGVDAGWKLADLRRVGKDDAQGGSLVEQLSAAYPTAIAPPP